MNNDKTGYLIQVNALRLKFQQNPLQILFII